MQQPVEKSLSYQRLAAIDAILRVRLTEKGATKFNELTKASQGLIKKLGWATLLENYQQGTAFEAPISFLIEIEDFYGKDLWDNSTIVV